MADPTVRALYQQAAKERNMHFFALTIADFMHTPSITNIDLSAYNGQVNDVIKIQAQDDFSVAKVHVALTQVNGGTPIESGYAVETAAGSAQWVYTATLSVSAGTNVNFTVVATDRPSGTAIDTQSKSV